jgi:hypothetical protein
MSTSNYQQIVEFHKAFGLEHHDDPQLHVLTEKPDLVKFRMSLINEEHEETKEATANNDLVETIDGDHAFSLVHKSNMSKLCVSETEAQETVQWYKDNEDRYDSPEYRRADIGDYWVVFNKSTGKILKSVNYKPVSFKEML